VRVAWTTALAVLCSSSLPSVALADEAGAGESALARVNADAAARASSDEREPGAPRPLALGVFVGYGSFGDSELGNSWAPEQVPGASPVVGARLGWLAVPELAGSGPLALSLALEAELALATASTGASGASGGRMSYFAPVFGWRAHALLRKPLGTEKLALHAVLGGGGATVASSSPFMAKETDPVAYAGLGATLAISGRWQLRLDGRQGVMPGRSSSATRVSELQFGLIAAFGGGGARRSAVVLAQPPGTGAGGAVAVGPGGPGTAPDPAQDEATDSDADGVPDRLDRCPAEPESHNGVDDADGCPEPDLDSDGVVGANDACPNEAEDLDKFEDEDGCPDRDNDQDGIEDTKDACPSEPETRNGLADVDGCPDAIPDTVMRALAAASAVKFERGRARVTADAKKALQPVLAVLQAQADLAISIAGTPDSTPGGGGDDLAKRRADAVKWHLVDQGIAEDRLDTVVGAAGGGVAGAAPPSIVLTLRLPKP
jgi:outer membrane protein OmpA-like peptidoglycan-associated protein